MNIRKLCLNDAKDFNEIRLRALLNSPESFGSSYEEEKNKKMQDILVEFNKHSNENFILGIFENQVLIGIAGFYREKQIKSNHKGVIWGVYIEPEYRGKRYGRQLIIQLIKEICLCNGLEQINIRVNSNNFSAKKLYSCLDFMEYGREKNALKINGSYFDEDLMVKFISK